MPKRTVYTDDGPVTIAVLEDWILGETKRVTPSSEVIQWIVEARWYNWSWEAREDITRDIEASNAIWVTPTRLGAWLQFYIRDRNEKKQVKCFIRLFDNRVMKIDCFNIQTYKEWFASFFEEMEESFFEEMEE